MVTLKQLVERAFDENNLTGKWELDRAAIEPIVIATIKGLGFHVAAESGEVCDPRAKAAEFQYEQKAPRWTGSGRRRGGGGR